MTSRLALSHGSVAEMAHRGGFIERFHLAFSVHWALAQMIQTGFVAWREGSFLAFCHRHRKCRIQRLCHRSPFRSIVDTMRFYSA